MMRIVWLGLLLFSMGCAQVGWRVGAINPDPAKQGVVLLAPKTRTFNKVYECDAHKASCVLVRGQYKNIESVHYVDGGNGIILQGKYRHYMFPVPPLIFISPGLENQVYFTPSANDEAAQIFFQNPNH